MRERGQHADAGALLNEGWEIARSADAQLLTMHFLPELASLQVAMGRADAALPLLERCRDIIAGGEEWFGLTGLLARAEGDFAASQGDLEAAMNHLSRSEEIFRTYSLPWELAGTLESWAKAAYAKGDQQIADDKIAAALAIYRSRAAGQPWIDSRAATRDHMCGARGSGPPRNIFRKQGEYWAISFGGAEVNLKDSKGLHYIACLLRNSGQQVSSVDLAALTNPHAPEIAIRAAALNEPGTDSRTDLGDAGEILDANTAKQYKHRLEDLREEIERGQSTNDPGTVEKARAEFDVLLEQLRAATGLGGRGRRAASHRERARVMVTKRIKAAIENIRASNPTLGRHLANSIRTGHFCCYAPADPGDWQF